MKPQRFYFEGLYEESHWTVLYQNSQGFSERFLQYCQQFLEASNFPNIEVGIAPFMTGGIIFNKEATPMVYMKPTNPQLAKLGAYFRAQQFGNVVYYSCLETIDRGFFELGLSGDQLYASIRSKCKNMAQWEEFMAIDNLANLVFHKAVEQFDPEYRTNKLLMAKR